MRVITTVCLLLMVAGCTARTTADGTPIISDGSLTGSIRELADPGSTYKARQAADDAKCREFGFKTGTEAYGNCRLQLEQIRATKQAADDQAAATRSANHSQTTSSQGLSLLCKDAISRGDNGAAFVHC